MRTHSSFLLAAASKKHGPSVDELESLEDDVDLHVDCLDVLIPCGPGPPATVASTGGTLVRTCYTHLLTVALVPLPN